MADRINPDHNHRQEAPIDGSLFGANPASAGDTLPGSLRPARNSLPGPRRSSPGRWRCRSA